MWLAHKPIMTMLMMLVMYVGVFMFQVFVVMLVFMAFRQVEPQANTHQEPRKRQLQRKRFAEGKDCQQRPDEWRERIVGSGSRGAEVTHGKNEHDQTNANTEKSNGARSGNHRQWRH